MPTSASSMSKSNISLSAEAFHTIAVFKNLKMSCMNTESVSDKHVLNLSFLAGFGSTPEIIKYVSNGPSLYFPCSQVT